MKLVKLIRCIAVSITITIGGKVNAYVFTGGPVFDYGSFAAWTAYNSELITGTAELSSQLNYYQDLLQQASDGLNLDFNVFDSLGSEFSLMNVLEERRNKIINLNIFGTESAVLDPRNENLNNKLSELNAYSDTSASNNWASNYESRAEYELDRDIAMRSYLNDQSDWVEPNIEGSEITDLDKVRIINNRNWSEQAVMQTSMAENRQKNSDVITFLNEEKLNSKISSEIEGRDAIVKMKALQTTVNIRNEEERHKMEQYRLNLWNTRAEIAEKQSKYDRNRETVGRILKK